jgi:hypothetical protein
MRNDSGMRQIPTKVQQQQQLQAQQGQGQNSPINSNPRLQNINSSQFQGEITH